jgi:transcriptional regulator with GAF, ATPase, and Fis domain
MAESSNRSVRSTREINLALEKQRQAITELRQRVESGKLERGYLEQSLSDFRLLIEDLIEERQKVVQYERTAKLYSVTRLINSSLELQTVLERVMDAVIELTSAERGFLMLRDEDGSLKVQVARNFDQANIGSDDLTLSRTLTNRVLESGQAVVTSNAAEDPRFAERESVVGYFLRSIVASPLRVRGEVLGVMYVDNRLKSGAFSADDTKLLDAFGEQAAIAIDNAIQVQEREKALKAQIRQLRIEIDEARKARQVSEIVETEYFQKLSEDAKRMRERNKAPKPDSSGETQSPR